MIKRVLVLTSSTGSGHDMRALAFRKWIRKIHGESVDVRIEHIIEDSSMLGRFGVWVYNTIQRHAPILHNIYFFIVELFILTHGQSVSFGGRYYRNLIRSYRPDVILSVHDSTNHGYFQDAKRILGEQTRCVTYCGEFSGGYGYTRNWINPVADLFISRTHSAGIYAVKMGIPAKKLQVFHKFLPPDSFENRIPVESKGDYLKQLGLDPDRFTVFLATGGYGANHHLRFLKAISSLCERIQAIVICGRNQAVFEKLTKWKAANPDFTIYIEGYSTKVSDFMQVADAIVTRGGANTTMEALHFGCPILYDSLGGLMPQEKCTVRYFLDHGAAVLINNPSRLAQVLHEWQDFGPQYAGIKGNLDNLHQDEDPRDLVRMILEG